MLEKNEYCRECGGLHPTGQLSNRGLCPRCGLKRWSEAVEQLRIKFGPIYEKWRTCYIAAMSGVLERLRKEL